MTMPEFNPNLPPNPITLEYLAGCIMGLNGRIDGLEARVANLESGQRQIFAAILTIGGAMIATLVGGIIAVLSRLG